MKRSLKVLCVLLATVICVLPLIPFVNGASVFQRQKKSIYLVLDDSFSMVNRPTYDANYSLQTLLAMTDKNDSVKLYFLNEKFGLSGNIEMSKKDNDMLSKVHDKYPEPTGGTPYTSVQIAQKELTAAASEGDETDYWLVVFTDGEFSMPAGLTTENDLQTFADKELANGTKPNVLYITVGGTSISNGNRDNLHVIDHTSIITAMTDAAKVISGRINVENVNYSADGKELTFSLPYPAKNIIVLTQNTRTKITDSKAASDLNISENYTITYPEPGYGLDKSTVCFITEKNNSSIGSGEVTLKFDKGLNPQNTTVLFEPAIGIVAHYYNSDGAEVDPKDLYISENCRIEFTICDSETKKPLDIGAFGGNVKYSSEVDGIKADSNVREFTINKDEIEIVLYAEMPDGYILETRQKYNFEVSRIITFTLSNGGKFKADITELKNAEGTRADILINGASISSAELKDFELDIEGENSFVSNFDIEKDEKNGGFIIHPKKGWISPLTPKDKTYKVNLTDKSTGKIYTADLTVEITGPRNWIPIIVFVLIVALIVYLIIVFATKTYFPKNLRFVLYLNKPDSGAKGKHGIKYTLGKIYWNEFTKCFKGNFTFFVHLFKQLLPNTRQCVTLYGIGSRGYYDQITIIANLSTVVYAEDKTLKYNETSKKFSSEYDVYNSNFIKIMGAENLTKKPKSKEKPRYTIDTGNVLVRKKVSSTNSKVYLHITRKTKKKLNK